MRLANCADGAHALCHGYQARYGPRAPHETLICTCDCGHATLIRSVRAATIVPPPGMSAEQFVEVLQRVDRRARAGEATP